MNKKAAAITIIALAALGLGAWYFVDGRSEWEWRENVDPMTDARAAEAILPSENKAAVLAVSCSEGELRAVFAFPKPMGDYSLGRMDFRFDQKEAERGYANYGDNFVGFGEITKWREARLLNGMLASQRLTVVFKPKSPDEEVHVFNLRGARKIASKLRREC